ncbi:MAG: hypothetical protein AAGF12_21440 [Myxococcota bacterium]
MAAQPAFNDGAEEAATNESTAEPADGGDHATEGTPDGEALDTGANEGSDGEVPDGLHVGISLSYDLGLGQSTRVIHGPRVGISFRLPDLPMLQLLGEVTYRLGPVIDDPGGDGRIDQIGGRVGVSLGMEQPWLEGRLRLGLDAVVPFVDLSSNFEAGDRAAVEVFVSLAVRSHYRLSADFAVFVEAGADLYITRSRWAIGGRRVYEPWPIRPFISVGARLF